MFAYKIKIYINKEILDRLFIPHLAVRVFAGLAQGSTDSDWVQTVYTACRVHLCPALVVVWALTHPSPPEEKICDFLFLHVSRDKGLELSSFQALP